MDIPKNPLYHAVRVMLRPIARFCLHRGLKVQDLIECIKFAFIDVALEQFEQLERRANVSKLSVATGLRRREVMRIYSEGDHKSWAVSLATRVINTWRHDRRFTTPQGRPRVLGLEGGTSDFARLVRAVTKDVSTASVLFDLERVEAVRRTPRGLELIVSARHAEKDLAEATTMLGEDVAGVIRAIEENVSLDRKVPNLHIRTVFDNIAKEDIEMIRTKIVIDGGAFHARLAKFIGRYDLDIHPRPGKTGGGKITVTSFGNSW